MTYRASAHTNGYEFAQGSGYTLPEYPFVEPPGLRDTAPLRYPVVIVGAGLTGLTAACALAQRGVRCVVLDEDNTVGVKGASSRGICYTQKSLEIFQRLGVYDRIAQRGIQWSVGRTFAGTDEVYSFDLREQAGFNLSRQPPFINIQQFYIEGYLVERIHELTAEKPSAELRWGSRAVGCTQNDGEDFATLEVETPAGTYRIEAQHVIDATGSHSPFHAWCNVRKQARRGDDRWCIADVRFAEHPPIERHTWIEAPFNDNRAVWQHLMADDVWRIDYQMAPDSDPSVVSQESEVRARLRRQFDGDPDCEIVWVGPYAYRSQCLEQLRAGRVFFIGDAAKIVSPFGARGGNTGVADADNLAWKLAAVIQGRAPAELLDSYEEERLEAAQQNVLVTHRTARFLRPADGVERLFRSAVIGLARQYPFARALVNTGRMAVANPYSRSSVCAEETCVSIPNVGLQWLDGSTACLNDLIGWADGRLLLLIFGALDAAALQRLAALNNQAPLRSVQALDMYASTQVRESIRDPQGHLRQACLAGGARGWALLRPDGYLAARGTTVDSGLVRAIEQALGLHQASEQAA